MRYIAGLFFVLVILILINLPVLVVRESYDSAAEGAVKAQQLAQKSGKLVIIQNTKPRQ